MYLGLPFRSVYFTVRRKSAAKKSRKRVGAVERSAMRGVKLTPSIQIEKVPIIVRAFFALLGNGEESTNGGEECGRK